VGVGSAETDIKYDDDGLEDAELSGDGDSEGGPTDELA